MSQIFTKDGKVVPVTILKAAPNKITQVKTTDKDKYQAVQLGFGRKKNTPPKHWPVTPKNWETLLTWWNSELKMRVNILADKR
jgi:ribosomal protein L3